MRSRGRDKLSVTPRAVTPAAEANNVAFSDERVGGIALITYASNTSTARFTSTRLIHNIFNTCHTPAWLYEFCKYRRVRSRAAIVIHAQCVCTGYGKTREKSGTREAREETPNCTLWEREGYIALTVLRDLFLC